MARFLLFLLSFTAVFFGSAGAFDTYYIGFLGNSTNASSVSLYNSLSLTVEASNNTNNSYTVQAVFFDEDSVSAADEIKNKGNLLAVLGCFSEKNTGIIEKINDIPLISTGKNYIAFNELQKENAFRVCPTEAQLAEDLSRFVIAVLVKNKSGIVYSEDSLDYLRAAEAFAANCRANKVWADYFKSVPADRTDFTAILQRLRDLKVQTIYFAGSMEQAAILSKASKDLNVGAIFTSTDVINSRAFIKTAKSGSENACFAAIMPASLNSMKSMRKVLAEFRKNFQNEDMHMPYVFDAANMVLKCLVNGSRNGRDIMTALKAMNYDGATGPINFNKSGIRVNANAYFYIISRKEVLPRSLGESAGKYWSAK